MRGSTHTRRSPHGVHLRRAAGPRLRRRRSPPARVDLPLLDGESVATTRCTTRSGSPSPRRSMATFDCSVFGRVVDASSAHSSSTSRSLRTVTPGSSASRTSNSVGFPDGIRTVSEPPRDRHRPQQGDRQHPASVGIRSLVTRVRTGRERQRSTPRSGCRDARRDGLERASGRARGPRQVGGTDRHDLAVAGRQRQRLRAARSNRFVTSGSPPLRLPSPPGSGRRQRSTRSTAPASPPIAPDHHVGPVLVHVATVAGPADADLTPSGPSVRSSSAPSPTIALTEALCRWAAMNKRGVGN